MHELEYLFFLCKATLILKYLQDKAPIFWILLFTVSCLLFNIYPTICLTFSYYQEYWIQIKQNCKNIFLDKVNIYNLWLRANYLIRICITFSLKWKNWQATQWKETVKKKKKLPFKLWLFNSVPWKDMKITPGLRTESNVNKTEGM